MKKRQDTKAQDIEKLYEVLESAAALLATRVIICPTQRGGP